jgi:hypothetical protein
MMDKGTIRATLELLRDSGIIRRDQYEVAIHRLGTKRPEVEAAVRTRRHNAALDRCRLVLRTLDEPISLVELSRRAHVHSSAMSRDVKPALRREGYPITERASRLGGPLIAPRSYAEEVAV